MSSLNEIRSRAVDKTQLPPCPADGVYEVEVDHKKVRYTIKNQMCSQCDDALKPYFSVEPPDDCSLVWAIVEHSRKVA